MSSASDHAYSTIRGIILSGELPAGAQIGEVALADRCGVSRTPVRDALRRLETELFVRRSESQRSFVADWSLNDIEDAFDLRAMLEGYAALRAAKRIDVGRLSRLRGHNEAIRRAVSRDVPNVQSFLEDNRVFHAIILEAAGSPRLGHLLSGIVEQPVVWRTAQNYNRDDLLRSCGEHDELLSAFSRGDGAWAQSIMHGHIRRAFHTYADAHEAGRARRGAAA